MHFHSLPAGHERLEINDTFRFSCHKKLSCFGECCGNRDLRITPYDALRLKQALKIHSDRFLSEYTLYTLDPSTGFPAISLKLTQDDRKRCPFLAPDGCGVYQDRPTVCRLFPLARVSGFKAGSTEREEYFYMLPKGPCLGGEEDRIQTIDEWLTEQGCTPYREANDKMLSLLFHPDRGNTRALSDKQLQKIIVACYNLDVFREFILTTDFFSVFSTGPETQSRVEENEFDLLMLGFDYLRTTLFLR